MIRAPFFGRAREIEEAFARLGEGARLVTLHGPPGAGKSRTLSRIAERSGRDVVEVAIGEIDQTAILVRLAGALAIEVRTEDWALISARIADELERRAILLVLDDADAAATLIETWLDASPRAQAVVSARTLLSIEGEVAITVDPLPLGDAIALLRDRVGRRSSLVLDDPTATRIVERADRLPLAIVLFAPRIATLGERALAVDPSSSFDSLRRALDAALDLPPELAAVLAQAAVFRAPFTVEAARAVIEGQGLDDALIELDARSLLRALGDGRFAMLGMVRARLRGRGLGEEIQARHAGHFAEWALAIDAHSSEGHLRRAEASEDLLAAFDFLAGADPALAARLAVALDPLLVTRGPPALHERILEQGLALAEGSVRSDLLRARGRRAALRGRHARSIEDQLAALALAGDRGRRGWSLAFLCFSLRALGRYDEAARAGADALAIAIELEDHALAAMSEQALGLLALLRGAGDDALDHHRRAAAWARKGAPRLHAIALANAAAAERALGRFAAAEASIAESIAIFEGIGDRLHSARVGVEAAALLLARGFGREAEAKLFALLPALEEADDREGQLERVLVLAEIARAEGDGSRVERWLADASVLAAQLDDVFHPAEIARLRALPAAASGAQALLVAADGRAFRLHGRHVDLGRRGAIRRVLVALVEERRARPGRGLDVEAILAAGWPGEKMRADSATARVYMAIRTLRALGLEAILLTRDDGYLLDPRLAVDWF